MIESPHAGESPGLRGRLNECAALDRVLDRARAGGSGVLVVRGEAGAGKSALLEYAREAARDLRIARAVGVESEMELPFAGLHQLCAPMLDGLDRLPDPQRRALGTAFGLTSGGQQDRFLVGLAVLTLLADAAGEQPLVCFVDDAQWFDRASLQALAFVARRLLAEPVALIFATRGSEDELTDLPELLVEGLGDSDARALLSAAVKGPLDERVRERILAESGGNPLALLELPRGLMSTDLAGGYAMPDLSLSGRIEASFRLRLESLPVDTRRLALLAAAEPVGDAALLWRACAQLGIDADAAAPAEDSGLFELGGRVTFFHPLVRSAVYRTASAAERRAAHRAIGEAIDPGVDPDRRAWHRAHAAAGPDEDVAAELERSAERAKARGGLSAAAAFLERAATLTPEPSLRADRAIAAAQAKHEAGAAQSALELLAIAEMGQLDELQRARADRLRGRLAFAQRRGSDAPPLLLRAARRFEPLDPVLARDTYLEALGTAISTGQRESLKQASEALRALPAPEPPRAGELLLTGQALVLTEGRAAGMPVLERALDAFRDEPISGEDGMRHLLFSCLVALSLWDDESFHVLSARHVEIARDAGALMALPLALEMHVLDRMHEGDFAAAQELLDEANAIAEAVGSVPVQDGMVLLAGWQGAEAVALERIDTAIRDATERGEESTITSAEHAAAVLYNGLARYDDALAAAQRSCEHHPAKAYIKGLIEMVEAAARSGERQLAEGALEQVCESTGLAGTDWALGIEARTRAVLGEGDDDVEGLYREAIERLARTRVRVDLARAHLLYGEWLRRERRRLDARFQLRTAHELFVAMGAQAFADRAARELLATGETARRRSVETRGELTAQEANIARLARDGHSNPEIGARLFISPRTVEYHLHKVFGKLGIRSRGELELALGHEPTATMPVS